MGYASLDQLTDRFGEDLLRQLTDRAQPPAGEIDTGVVDRALADADAVIDGDLLGRYALPLAETPPLLIDFALVIGIYKLHTFTPDPKIAKDYELAIAELVKIGKGTIKLPVAGVEPVSSGAAGVEATDRARDFTPENLRGFI